MAWSICHGMPQVHTSGSNFQVFFEHSAFFECQSPISCPGSLAELLETPHSMALANAKFSASSASSLVIDSCIERRANNTYIIKKGAI